MNVLIRAKREKVEHKIKENCPESSYCYWTGVRPKKQVDKVLFTDGENVYAEGDVIGVDYIDDIIFRPLKRVEYPQPKKAPTRGFTYVEQG